MLPRSGVSTSLQSLESLPIRPRKEAGELYDLFLLAGIVDPEQGRVYETLGSGKFRDLEQALGYFESKPETLKLSQNLRKDWGAFLEELTDVFKEPDRETFYYSLLELGGRLQREGDLGKSARVYAALVSEQEAPEGVKQKAQEQFLAITGGGSGWRRFGYSLSQLPEELTHVTPLMAMTGAGLAFKGTRLALSLRWGERIESAWALNAVTTSAAFAAETVAFTGLEMGLGELGGVRQDWSGENIYRHWGSGAATLLGLKASGWAVRSGIGRVYEGSTVRSVSRRVTEKLAPQLGMFTGVLAGNRIAEWKGFHEAQRGDSWLVTGAASLIRLNAVGLIQQRANVFKGLELSAEIYRSNLVSRLGIRSGWEDLISRLGPQPVTAEGFRAEPPAWKDARRLNVFSVQDERAAVESRGSVEGGGIPVAKMASPPTLEQFQQWCIEVLEQGRQDDVRKLKDFLYELYSESTKGALGAFATYRKSNHRGDWELFVRGVVTFSRDHPELWANSQKIPGIVDLFKDWHERPRYGDRRPIPVEVGGKPWKSPETDTPVKRFVGAFQAEPTLENLRRLMASGIKDSRTKLLQIQGEFFRDPNGEEVFVGNLVTNNGKQKKIGMVLRFKVSGYIRAPIQISAAFSDHDLREWGSLRSARSEPGIASAEAGVSYAPTAGESPQAWGRRLFEASKQKQDELQLQVALSLEAVLSNPETRAFGLEAVAELRAIGSASAKDGEYVLVRDYTLPGLKAPLTILSLPSTFLPENWSKFFAEKVIADIRKNGGKVEQALEIGSGTGWLSLYLAKLGVVKNVTGIDLNPSAVAVSRINAILNGVEGAEFFASDLLKGIPADRRFDLVVACIPQIPSDQTLSDRAIADQYVARPNSMAPYGLGLVFDALRDARPYLTANGRVLFNLAGRPGLETLKEMYHRAGYLPIVHYPETIPQDPTTSLSPLVSLEATYGIEFEFLSPISERVMNAQLAMRTSGIRHRQYLIEGIPYERFFREATGPALQGREFLGYTADAGSEAPALRTALQSFIKREWGLEVPQEGLFIGPSHEVMTASLIRLTVPAGASVAWLGTESGFRSVVEARLPQVRHETLLDITGWKDFLAEHSPRSIVVQVEEWKLSQQKHQEALLGLLQETAKKKIALIFVQAHPRRNSAGLHPFSKVLDIIPDAQPYVAILQPLHERFGLVGFPLTAAVIPNAQLYRNLADAGEVDYSRLSTPLQLSYAALLRNLPAPRLSSHHPRVVRLESVAFAGVFPAAELSSPQVSSFGPRGAHPDSIDMSFGASEMPFTIDIRSALAGAIGVSPSLLQQQAVAAVADYLRESRGVDYAPEQIVLGAGVQPLLPAVLQALPQVRGSEFRFGVSIPSYLMYGRTMDRVGVRRVAIPTSFGNRFLVTGEDLRRAMPFQPGSPRALLINSPTNPVGQYYDAAELAELIAALRPVKKGDPGGHLILDDVYGMVAVPQGRQARRAMKPSIWEVLWRNMPDRMIGLGGLSKEFPVPGVRFGFAALPTVDLAEGVRRNLSFPPDAFALAAAAELLPQWKQAVEAHRNYLFYPKTALEGFFKAKGIPFHEAQGGYALFVDLTPLYGKRISMGPGKAVTLSAENLHDVLFTQVGIKIHSDQWGGVKGHYRFVYSIDRIDEAIQRLEAFFRKLR